MDGSIEILRQKYGDHFHLRPPAGATPIYKEQTISVADITAAQNFQICRYKSEARNCLVLHMYGLLAAQLVPSTDYVGFEYEPINPLALGGRIRWSVQSGVSKSINAGVIREDNSAHEGFSLLRTFAVGQGGQPLIFTDQVLVQMVVEIINPASGADISPDNARLTGYFSGYSINI